MILELIFPGKPMSGNHSQMPQQIGRTKTGAPRFRMIRTAEARVADEKVARIHVQALGGELTKLSKDQAEYIGVDVEGPYKPDHYRY